MFDEVDMGGGLGSAEVMDTATLDFWKELSDSSDSGIDCKSTRLLNWLNSYSENSIRITSVWTVVVYLA